MKPEQTTEIVDQLLQDAAAGRDSALAVVARRRSTTARFVAGMMGIVGYHVGMKLAPEFTTAPISQFCIAMAIGLLAAVVWPPRWQT